MADHIAWSRSVVVRERGSDARMGTLYLTDTEVLFINLGADADTGLDGQGVAGGTPSALALLLFPILDLFRRLGGRASRDATVDQLENVELAEGHMPLDTQYEQCAGSFRHPFAKVEKTRKKGRSRVILETTLGDVYDIDTRGDPDTLIGLLDAVRA